MNGDWLVKRAEHYIGPNGYNTTLKCEQPNSTDAPSNASAAESTDHVQAATVVE